MKISIPKGKYVVAVSGGVDSMSLLDLLTKQSGLKLIVAHFNHGIRPESKLDEELVLRSSRDYNLPFEAAHGKLGPNTSEEKAREARYKFLKTLKQDHKADGIITAHHQDDLIETAILNLLRGTGRQGVTAISQNPDVFRPLLHWSKKDILAYAQEKDLQWREDPTNQEKKYLRNYIRRRIIPKLTPSKRRQFLAKIGRLDVLNSVVNQEIANMSQKLVEGNSLMRSDFISLPDEIAKEVLMHFLRQNEIREFDRKTIARLTVMIKTAKPGTKHEVIKGRKLEINRLNALLS